MLTVLTVFSRDVRILITLFPARPSRLKGNIDAERPQKCLRPTQVAGEGAGIFGPADAAACLTGAFSAGLQKIGSATRPRAALAHEVPHASGDRVRVDNALDRSLAVGP